MHSQEGKPRKVQRSPEKSVCLSESSYLPLPKGRHLGAKAAAGGSPRLSPVVPGQVKTSA